MLAVSSGGEELSRSLLGAAIGAVRDCGRGLVVFEGIDKLGPLLRRQRGDVDRRHYSVWSWESRSAWGRVCHLCILPSRMSKVRPPTERHVAVAPRCKMCSDRAWSGAQVLGRFRDWLIARVRETAEREAAQARQRAADVAPAAADLEPVEELARLVGELNAERSHNGDVAGADRRDVRGKRVPLQQ